MEQNSENNEEEQLREWAIKGNISWVLISQLLLILRRRLIPQLPKTATTFLNVKTNFNIKSMTNCLYKTAEFVYFGLGKGLASCFNSVLHSDGIIYLHINIDELNDYQKNGVMLEGKLYKERIKSFILDTPARALVKCVKGHAGYFSCERCEVIGERCQNRTVFLDTNAAERTDKSFREQKQPEHHKGTSPLLNLSGLNMITMFVLDFMHLGFLGVMKKLLSLWLNSTIRKFKFSSSQKEKVNFMLHELKN